MNALDLLGRVSAILCGLCLMGGSFLVWSRSRGAALLGALAGAAMLFFEIVYIVLGAVVRSGNISPNVMSVLFATANVLQALGTYLPLGIMALLLARSRARG